MNTERDFTSLYEFQQNEKLVLQTVKVMKKHYDRYARKVNGMVNNHDIEQKVFKKAKKDLQPLSDYQDQIVESLFDSFLGLLGVVGGSAETFEALKQMTKK